MLLFFKKSYQHFFTISVQPLGPPFPPIIVKSDDDAVFHKWIPENVLDPACDDYDIGNYYLATDSQPEIWIDVGLFVVFTSVSLRNTDNGRLVDRYYISTEHFTMLYTKDINDQILKIYVISRYVTSPLN